MNQSCFFDIYILSLTEGFGRQQLICSFLYRCKHYNDPLSFNGDAWGSRIYILTTSLMLSVNRFLIASRQVAWTTTRFHCELCNSVWCDFCCCQSGKVRKRSGWFVHCIRLTGKPGAISIDV